MPGASVAVDALFHGDKPLDVRTIAIAVGKDRGIRDLTPMPGGRLLVLAGPAQGQVKAGYALFALDPGTGASRPLATLTTIENPDPKKEGGKVVTGDVHYKPEAIVVLGNDATTLRVMVFHDNRPNGAPLLYDVPLK